MPTNLEQIHQLLINRFQSNPNVFMKQWNDTFQVIHKSPTIDDTDEHLRGYYRMGFYTIYKNKTSCGVLDFDGHGGQEFIAYGMGKKVYELCMAEGWTCILERSKSGGAHCWFPFSRPISAKSARRFLYDLLTYTFGEDVLDEIGVEVFPKQSDAGDGIGNAVFIPLYAMGCDRDFPLRTQIHTPNPKKDPDGLGVLYQAKGISPYQLSKAIKEMDITHEKGSYESLPLTGNDLYPILEPGSRNTTLYLTGIRLIKAGYMVDKAIEHIHHLNWACEHPLSLREIDSIARSISRSKAANHGCVIR